MDERKVTDNSKTQNIDILQKSTKIKQSNDTDNKDSDEYDKSKGEPICPYCKEILVSWPYRKKKNAHFARTSCT